MKKEYNKPTLEFVSFLSDEELLSPIDGDMGWSEVGDDEEWN